MPSSVLPLSTSTIRPASARPTTKLSVSKELTRLSPPPTETMVTVGATVSTAKVSAAEAPSLPAASLWRAVMDLLGPWPKALRLLAESA